MLHNSFIIFWEQEEKKFTIRIRTPEAAAQTSFHREGNQGAKDYLRVLFLIRLIKKTKQNDEKRERKKRKVLLFIEDLLLLFIDIIIISFWLCIYVFYHSYYLFLKILVMLALW